MGTLQGAGESTVGILHEDAIPALKEAVCGQWQQERDMEGTNKLHVTQPQVYSPHQTEYRNVSAEALYARLRIQYTQLTYRCPLRGQDLPACVHSGDNLSHNC